MDGYVLRIEGNDCVERFLEAPGAVGRKSGYEIHVDCHAADLAHLFQRLNYIGRRVPASDNVQHLIAHCLGVYAYPVNAVSAQSAQLIDRYGVRPAGLDGIFAQCGKINALGNFGAKPVKLLKSERCRRSAAHVN